MMELSDLLITLASVLSGVGAGVGTGIAINKANIAHLKERLDRHEKVHTDLYGKIWNIINR